ncbi:MAG TPA: RelA/SpoT family protein, partial [Pseudomonadales bacterium]|nr:RelA/SpoT family protein [Pseudomonadales bacterium]
MHEFRTEFEDLGFQAMYPMRASRIKRAVKVARGNRKDTILLIQDALSKALERDGIPGRVIHREKHLYSIYQKMRSKRRSFAQLMDAYSFRVVVDKIDTCYRVLGVVHNLYKPIPGRFKDYIAIPKANGYQSLHTTLKGLNGMPIDIQIRTEEMEAMANNGITAQWMFRSEKNIANTAQSRAREWMKSLLEIQQNSGNSLEFIETVKTDLFPDEVYVFTPKGRIMGLPMGATAVDFAYAVHTDVGNTCVAARVDNRLAPLSMPIQSGQTVQIITAPGASPNPAWLNFVITAKARSNIRHFLKHQQRSQSVELGRRLLDKVLSDLDLSLDKISEKSIKRVLQESNFKAIEDLYEDIGLGNRMAQIVAHQLAFDKSTKVQDMDNADISPLAIRGTEGLVVTYAKCCRPVPGDAIVGHLSSGRGVVIHRSNCKNMNVEARDNPEKCIPLTWASEIKGEFPVELRVEIENQRGILATVAATLTEADATVESINLKEMDGRLSVIKLRICVKDRINLAHAIKRLRAMPGVSKISRIKN